MSITGRIVVSPERLPGLSRAARPDHRQHGSGKCTPGAEHGRGECCSRAVQRAERQCRCHATVLHTHLDAQGAAVAGVEPCGPGCYVADEEARRIVAHRRREQRQPDAAEVRRGQGHADLGESGSLPDDPLERACTYLELHLAEPVSLGFLAEHVARTSSGHLARLFRERRRVSFTGYVQQLRLHRAVGLLTATREPIQRVATLVGYTDPSRFAAHFRRHYGLTPRAYRGRFCGPQAAVTDA